MIFNSSKTVILNVAFTDKPAMHFDVNYIWMMMMFFSLPLSTPKVLGAVVDNT